MEFQSRRERVKGKKDIYIYIYKKREKVKRVIETGEKKSKRERKKLKKIN